MLTSPPPIIDLFYLRLIKLIPGLIPAGLINDPARICDAL